MPGLQSLRRTLLAVATGSAALALVVTSTMRADAAGTLTGYSFDGWAGGTLAKSASNQVISDLTAPSSINGARLTSASNTLAGVTLSAAFHTGAVNTSTAATEISGGYQVRSTSRVANVIALGGFVSADAVVVTTVAKVVNGVASHSVSTTFVDLKVGAIQMPASVPANTVMKDTDVASVVLNNSISGAAGSHSYSYGTGILITLVKPSGSFPAGTSISIAPTFAAVGPNQTPSGHALYGHSFGTKVIGNRLAGTGIAAKESAPVTLQPAGTAGIPITSQAAAVALDPHASVGAVNDTVSGTNTTTAYAGRATASVSGVSLFDGLVTADAVTSTAVVQGAATATDPSTLAGSSTSSNLVIAGKAYTSVPPNTRVKLPFAVVTINQSIRLSTGALVVRALDIHLTKAAYGFPAGAEIQVACSRIAEF